jgi:hypothetical protein
MIKVLSATAGALGLTPQEQTALATKRVYVSVALYGAGLLALGLLWATAPERKNRYLSLSAASVRTVS